MKSYGAAVSLEMKSCGAAVLLLMLLFSSLPVGAVESGASAASCLSEVRKVQREMVALMEEQKLEMQQAKTQLELQIQTLSNRVAFSTSFSTKTDRHIGPFQQDVTLKFDCVFLNLGNAYNKDTGIFTAPFKGFYMFHYHVFAGGDNGAGAKLYRNKDQVVAAYNHVAPHDINTSQSVALKLAEGDQISLLLEKGWWVAAYQGHLTTFSGHLIAY